MATIDFGGVVEDVTTVEEFPLVKAREVLADETIGMVKRYMRGFQIDGDHLALEIIKQVGPGGNFLQEKHTLEFFMQEHWQPGVFNRKNLPNWIKDGKKKTDDKLLERARDILATHRPEPLAAEIKSELDQIWKNTEAAAHK